MTGPRLAFINATSDWMDAAACLGATADEAFPDDMTGARKFITDNCTWCPVAMQCREFANATGVAEGIWGGLLYTQGHPIDPFGGLGGE